MGSDGAEVSLGTCLQMAHPLYVQSGPQIWYNKEINGELSDDCNVQCDPDKWFAWQRPGEYSKPARVEDVHLNRSLHRRQVAHLFGQTVDYVTKCDWPSTRQTTIAAHSARASRRACSSSHFLICWLAPTCLLPGRHRSPMCLQSPPCLTLSRWTAGVSLGLLHISARWPPRSRQWGKCVEWLSQSSSSRSEHIANCGTNLTHHSIWPSVSTMRPSICYCVNGRCSVPSHICERLPGQAHIYAHSILSRRECSQCSNFLVNLQVTVHLPLAKYRVNLWQNLRLWCALRVHRPRGH